MSTHRQLFQWSSTIKTKPKLWVWFPPHTQGEHDNHYTIKHFIWHNLKMIPFIFNTSMKNVINMLFYNQTKYKRRSFILKKTTSHYYIFHEWTISIYINNILHLNKVLQKILMAQPSSSVANHKLPRDDEDGSAVENFSNTLFKCMNE
jgi:hypothetical protein